MLFCQIHGDLNDLIYMINELKITNNQVIEHLETEFTCCSSFNS